MAQKPQSDIQETLVTHLNFGTSDADNLSTRGHVSEANNLSKTTKDIIKTMIDQKNESPLSTIISFTSTRRVYLILVSYFQESSSKTRFPQQHK